MIFAASYEQKISIYELPNKFEANLFKLLVGHNSMITAIELIDERNILISIDDTCCLKCWDMSLKQCIQTYKFDYFVEVSALIKINQAQFLSVSNRMHLFTILSVNFSRKLTDFQFEDPYFLIRDFIGPQYKGVLDDPNEELLKTMVIDVFYCESFQKIIAVTKRDVRIFNMSTGKQEFIMTKISSNDCELTECCLENTTLVLSDIDGRLYQIDVMKQERHEIEPQCESQVMMIRVDIKNQMILTWEESLDRIRVYRMIKDYQTSQSLKNNEESIVREFINCAGADDNIELLHVSFYLNQLLILGSKSQQVEVWSFDQFNRIGRLNRLQNQVISQIGTIDERGLAFILNQENTLEIYNIKAEQFKYNFFQKVSTLNLSYDGQIQCVEFNNNIIIATDDAGTLLKFSSDFQQQYEKVLDVRDNKTLIFQKKTKVDGSVVQFLGQKHKNKSFIPQNLVLNLEKSNKLHSNKLTKMHCFSLGNDLFLLTLDILGFVKIYSFFNGLVSNVKPDKPLPLKWNLNFPVDQQIEEEIRNASTTLIKLGYRRQNELGQIIAKIKVQKVSDKLVMPEQIKAYYKKKRQDNKKNFSMEYLQYKVDKLHQKAHQTAQIFESLHRREDTNNIKSRMEQAEGKLMKEKSVMEFFQTRNFLNVEKDFEEVKDKILGLTYKNNEGDKVCEEFLGTAKTVVEKKETEKKTLPQELEEGFNQVEFKSKVKQSTAWQLIGKRIVAISMDYQNKLLEKKLKDENEEEEERKRALLHAKKLNHWLEYSHCRVPKILKISSPEKYSYTQRDFKNQIAQLNEKVTAVKKSIVFNSFSTLPQQFHQNNSAHQERKGGNEGLQKLPNLTPLSTIKIQKEPLQEQAFVILKSTQNSPLNHSQKRTQASRKRIQNILKKNESEKPEQFKTFCSQSHQRSKSSQSNLFKTGFLTQRAISTSDEIVNKSYKETFGKFYPPSTPAIVPQISFKRLKQMPLNPGINMKKEGKPQKVEEIISAYQDYSQSLYDHILSKIESGIMNKLTQSQASTSIHTLTTAVKK